MTARIPVSPETLKRVRDFRQGVDGTYDQVLNWVLDKITGNNDPMIYGRQMRDEFQCIEHPETATDARIPVSPETLQRIRDFRQGLDGTYDQALNWGFDRLIDNKDPMIAGRQMRDEFKESERNDTPSNKAS